MTEYLIQKAIRTPVHLYVEQNHAPFRLIPRENRGFIAQARFEGRDHREAYRDFILALEPILSIISVLTQCPIYATALSSHVVYRIDENEDRVAVFSYVGSGPPVGMAFHDQERRDLKRILQHRDWERFELAFRFLRQGNLATSPIAWITPLIMAVEAIAGEEKSQRECGNCKATLICKECAARQEFSRSNRQSLREILGEVLYGKLYKSGGIRHKLFHGKLKSEREVGAIAEQLHHRVLLEYLTEMFGLASPRPIQNAPRTIRFEAGARFVCLEDRRIDAHLLNSLEETDELADVAPPEWY